MNWHQENNQLVRNFEFNTQTELAEFLVLVAKVSDEVNHHADMQIYDCSKLRIILFTHSTTSITEQDKQLAKRIDELYNLLGS